MCDKLNVYKCLDYLRLSEKISLENATVSEGTPINNNRWVINLTTPERLFHLCPETENDYFNWLEALRNTITKQQVEQHRGGHSKIGEKSGNLSTKSGKNFHTVSIDTALCRMS